MYERVEVVMSYQDVNFSPCWNVLYMVSLAVFLVK